MASVPAIVVQGGAGSYTTVFDKPEERAAILQGVCETAAAGYKVLQHGGTAVDAVQAAVTYMEDSPLFNAGYGSYLTNECTIEMDASIMDGATLQTGAVACISNVRNPIQVARLVMDKTSHTMLCTDSARLLAEQEGFEIVNTEDLITAKAIKRLQAVPNFKPSVNKEFYEKLSNLSIYEATTKEPTGNKDDHDTVGAVAVDCHGNIAYATSTGGISAKMCGRVGDSPIVGSGGYADNRGGAVSTTGHGEAFVKMCTAKHASMLMEQGKTPQEAAKEVMDLMQERVNGLGGCITINCHGDIGVYMTSEGMAWAAIKDNLIQSGIYKGDVQETAYTE